MSTIFEIGAVVVLLSALSALGLVAWQEFSDWRKRRNCPICQKLNRAGR